MSQNLMPEKDALNRHFFERPPSGGIRVFTGFIAALGDARVITERDATGKKIPERPHGSWLGAIGYMALLDQIGTCFKPKSTPEVQGNTIKKALSYFSSLSEDEINAIYALRCAFAHDFSLFNINLSNPKLTHHFLVCQGTTGKVVKLPKVPWDGDYNNRNSNSVTTVNLERFGDLVEEVRKKLIDLVQNDQLEIMLLGGSDELILKYSISTRIS